MAHCQHRQAEGLHKRVRQRHLRKTHMLESISQQGAGTCSAVAAAARTC
jgi:hypothetical protein